MPAGNDGVVDYIKASVPAVFNCGANIEPGNRDGFAGRAATGDQGTAHLIRRLALLCLALRDDADNGFTPSGNGEFLAMLNGGKDFSEAGFCFEDGDGFHWCPLVIWLV